MPTWLKILAIVIAAILLVMALMLFVSSRKRGRRSGVFSYKTRERFLRTRTRRSGRS